MRRVSLGQWRWVWVALSTSSVSCNADDHLSDEPSRETLLDPATCRGCHPGQYDEWAGSMHAYASDDPVFQAMNARGQEETGGRLGNFCAQCHAPMAVREGLTDDGTNLNELSSAYRGVTCYFCHTIDKVVDDHNNALRLSGDGTFRGPFDDAQVTEAHASSQSVFFDHDDARSSAACGSCHDVQVKHPTSGQSFALERTYAEWQETLFARPAGEGGLGCLDCHMPRSPTRNTATSLPGAPERRSARHDFAGLDLALTEFPGRARQRSLVEGALASALLAEICVSETGVIQLSLENAGVGHHFPSGASHQREAWLEVRAYTPDSITPIFETVAPEHRTADKEAIVLKDSVIDAAGEPAHMIWDIAGLKSSSTLPGAATRDPSHPDFHRERRVFVLGHNQPDIHRIERVELTVRVRPIALEVLDDLVSTGHLDPKWAEAMPILDALPNRCITQELAERHPDLLASSASCDSVPARDVTLEWADAVANTSNPTFRATVIEGVPARCLSHPTYVPTEVPNTR